MTNATKNFYLFLGFHNFLLGLFPFFLPVYMYKQGVELCDISWFIGITGLSFVASLWVLDRVRNKSYLQPLLASFLLEACLLCLLLLDGPLYLLALVNGSYTCCYWMIQRILFLSGATENDSGRKFGNFQIYVLLFLKVGIFSGGVLLDSFGVWAVALLTFTSALIAVISFIKKRKSLTFPVDLVELKPLDAGTIIKFSDGFNSRLIFLVDGVFLYLESYFWVISLFLIVGESFARLGLLIIVLAISLSIIFFMIKNRIDNFDKQKVYVVAVVLYVISWLMRGNLVEESSESLQMTLLLLIAFSTSFFRLAFNKRFFDLAQVSTRYHYLFIKSYYSQIGLAFFFIIFGYAAFDYPDVERLLNLSYWVAALSAGVYFVYHPREKKIPGGVVATTLQSRTSQVK